MREFFATYSIEIILALITAGALWACRHFAKKFNDLRKLVESQKEAELNAFVGKKLEPIYQELEDLRKYVRENDLSVNNKLNLIVASYRYRLIQLCQEHLKAGQMTSCEYTQLTELYKLYTGLGGNGQAKEFYDKTVQLPLVD